MIFYFREKLKCDVSALNKESLHNKTSPLVKTQSIVDGMKERIQLLLQVSSWAESINIQF